MKQTTATDSAIENAARRLEGRIGDENRRLSFLNSHKGEPRLRLITEYSYRHQVMQSETGIPDTEKGKPLLEKLALSAPMDDERQFEALSRLVWLLDSFSGVTRDSRQLGLYKLEGLNKYSLDALAHTNGFDMVTLQSPGLAEPWALTDIGVAALAAAATGTTATLRLYGPRSAALNRHLRTKTPDELATMYETRDSLLTAMNVPVIKIDVPEVSKKFATARAMMELGYFASIELDEGFVKYLMQKEERLGQVVEDRSDPIWQYAHKTLTPNDYGKLGSLLQESVAKFGLKILESEGVTDIADIILRVEDFKEPKDAGGQAIPKDLIPRGSRKRSEIWKKLFPSNLASQLIQGVTRVKGDFAKLDYDAKKPWLMYSTGETLDIVKQLTENPNVVLVKFGSPPERYWDDTVYTIFGSPQSVVDTFWLFGGIQPKIKTEDGNLIMPEHGVFASVLYGNSVISQKTYTRSHKQIVARPTYIPYGPSNNKILADEIPFISDTNDELVRKLSIMDSHDPDQISRMVVGAIYCLMTPGEGTPQEQRRFNKNMKALFRAAKTLPPAYRDSIRLLNPNDVPRIIDTRMEEEYQARRRASEQFDTGLMDGLDTKVLQFESWVKDKRAKVKADTLTAILAGIRGLAGNLEHAVAIAETYIPNRYALDYIGDLQEFSEHNADPKAILEFKLNQLANTFLRFYIVAPRRRETDDKSQVLISFLHEKAKVDGVYDLGALEDALESSQEHTFQIARQLQQLRDSTIARRGVYGSSPQDRGLKAANGQLIGIGKYLDTIEETIRHLLDRKSKLADLLGSYGSYAAVPSDVAKKLRPLLSSINGFVDNALDYLIWGLDRGDLMHFLKLRFDNKYAKLEQRVRDAESGKAERTAESAEKFYHNEFMYPKDEIRLLQQLDAKLRAYEDKYMRATRRLRYHQATVMLPHELQQFDAVRNILETLLQYYNMASQYIEGSADTRPFDPKLRTYRAKSAYSMSPQEAASFLSLLFAHLDKYKGVPHIEAQRVRVAAFPIKSLDIEAA